MEKVFYTYVLYSSAFRRLYIGHTDNLEERINRHNSGFVQSTKPYRPYKVIYLEKFFTRIEAINREKELKTLEGRNYVRQFINNK